jgi:NCAIR mutase (PurE)-related protein
VDLERLITLLEGVQAGSTSVDAAVASLRDLPFEMLGYARVDHQRAIRTGFPEVIFCPGKTAEQIGGILDALAARHDRVLATRCTPDVAAAVILTRPEVTYHAVPRLLTMGYASPAPGKGEIAVFAAGTADLSVAEEAAMTAEMAGVVVRRVWDVGVAGIHRLLDQRQQLEGVDCVIAVAGMEGALASVLGGLTDRPIIGVPTSVGYGASFGGTAALLAMLNSCASGLAVMNIDNGFGAGHLAARIARQVAHARNGDREATNLVLEGVE